jgi:predicted N-formylglutamate amidohydrolase
MIGTIPRSLLDSDEPPSFAVINPRAGSVFVLTCDHASALIPRQLNQLGLAQEALARHIAFDLGAAEVTTQLAERLDGWAILQNYSRLVIDCNRPLQAADSIVATSDGTAIPGNQALQQEDILRRQATLFLPYHQRISDELDGRRQRSLPIVLVAIHSFTPMLAGRRRPWQAGILYHRDDRVARIMLQSLRAQDGAVIGDNEPYSMSDGTDFTIPVHGEQRGLPHVEVELRQDLTVSDESRSDWVERLAIALHQAEDELLSYCRP